MKEIATVFVFNSETSDKQYQCLQYVDGSCSCDCRGFIFKRGDGPRSCRHTRFVAAGLGARHAVSVVEQSTPAKRTPQRAMPEPTLERSRRKFDLV